MGVETWNDGYVHIWEGTTDRKVHLTGSGHHSVYTTNYAITYLSIWDGAGNETFLSVRSTPPFTPIQAMTAMSSNPASMPRSRAVPGSKTSQPIIWPGRSISLSLTGGASARSTCQRGTATSSAAMATTRFRHTGCPRRLWKMRGAITRWH